MTNRIHEIKKGVAFMKEAMADERVTEKELGYAVRGMIGAIESLLSDDYLDPEVRKAFFGLLVNNLRVLAEDALDEEYIYMTALADKIEAGEASKDDFLEAIEICEV